MNTEHRCISNYRGKLRPNVTVQEQNPKLCFTGTMLLSMVLGILVAVSMLDHMTIDTVTYLATITQTLVR